MLGMISCEGDSSICRDEMSAVVAAAGKLAQNGSGLLRAQKPPLSVAARTARLGATPSLADCVQGLQAIW